MIDIDAIKRSFDCRQIVERDLGEPRFGSHDYSAFKCPFHHERKGYSLVVYATHWRCFGKCGAGGDVISWVMRYHQLSFQRACERLAAGELPQTTKPVIRPKPQPEPRAEPPHETWQKVARRIAEQAADRLRSDAGRRALDYLKTKRGLTEGIIAAAQLGYVPGKPSEWKEINGMKVPCGITILWYADGAIWGIKVRRAAGEQRYQQVSGGNLKGGLYLADHIVPGLPIFLTEGEFDALIAWQVGCGKQSAASIGSASNWRISTRWFGKLMSAPRILVCMDADGAGVRAATEIALMSSAMRLTQVPREKDVNAFYLVVGQRVFEEWFEKELSGD